MAKKQQRTEPFAVRVSGATAAGVIINFLLKNAANEIGNPDLVDHASFAFAAELFCRRPELLWAVCREEGLITDHPYIDTAVRAIEAAHEDGDISRAMELLCGDGWDIKWHK